ncbi:MAG: hypothetical protein IJB35_05185, partial [Oscillospiraceae bacterium]|nr:hypothetical protein [Oscillospiraceae bacterium]
EIDCIDRSGIWIDIATVLNAAKVKVSEISARELSAGKARTVATFEVKSVGELETIRQKMRSIEGVYDVRRGQS